MHLRGPRSAVGKSLEILGDKTGRPGRMVTRRGAARASELKASSTMSDRRANQDRCPGPALLRLPIQGHVRTKAKWPVGGRNPDTLSRASVITAGRTIGLACQMEADSPGGPLFFVYATSSIPRAYGSYLSSFSFHPRPYISTRGAPGRCNPREHPRRDPASDPLNQRGATGHAFSYSFRQDPPTSWFTCLFPFLPFSRTDSAWF